MPTKGYRTLTERDAARLAGHDAIRARHLVLEAQSRKFALDSAGFWFRSARSEQAAGNMDAALMCMENAFNHTENALVALRAQRGSANEN